MRLVLVTPPTVEPLTAAEAKSRLNIGSEVADATIEAFIKAARQELDGKGWLGRALIRQTWKLVLDGSFPCDPIRIPLPPLIGVNSVKYIDVDGVQQTWDGNLYHTVISDPASYLAPVNGGSWPQARCQLSAAEIEFDVGYGTSGSAVPEPIRAAIALSVSNLRSLSARNLFVSQDTVDGVGSKNYVVGGNAGAAIDAAVSSLLSTYRVFA